MLNSGLPIQNSRTVREERARNKDAIIRSAWRRRAWWSPHSARIGPSPDSPEAIRVSRLPSFTWQFIYILDSGRVIVRTNLRRCSERRVHSIVTKFEVRDGNPVLVREPQMDFVDDALGHALGCWFTTRMRRASSRTIADQLLASLTAASTKRRNEAGRWWTWRRIGSTSSLSKQN